MRARKHLLSKGELRKEGIMDTVPRILMLLVGAWAGAEFVSSAGHLFGALMGAAIAHGIAELIAVRSRIRSLEVELGRLRGEVREAGGTRSETRRTSTDSTNAHEIDTTAAAGYEELEGADEDPESVLSEDVMESPIGASPQTSGRAVFSSLPISADIPLIGTVKRFFSGGNTLVRVGVVILFFGVAFLLRYMAEHTHVPIEWRLSTIAIGGIALLVLGWRLRSSRAGYALALQGGATGILYLTVFAALRLYAVLPAEIAFPLLAAVAVLSATLAIAQNSMALGLLAVTGGFLAPVLASTGEGNHVVLFSYYAVLNAGILAMAWFKAWRPLNIAGFLFTFAIGTAWGVLRYRPESFASTEPFLILFFLFYLAIAVLFTFRQPVNLKGYIDGTLIFATPIVVFGLQSWMLHDRPMTLAYSALAMSALYIAAAWLLKHGRNDSQRPLIESFIAIGVVFLTLAIPLALDARWNAAAWALEGTALIWVGCRQERALPRWGGAFLIIASGYISATQFQGVGTHFYLPLASYFGIILQSVAATISAHIMHAHRQRLGRLEEAHPGFLFVWGAAWWSIGGISEILEYWPSHGLAWALIFLTLTTLAWSVIYRRYELPAARIGSLLQLPMMMACAADAAGLPHPFVGEGWLAWPLAFAGLYIMLYAYGAPVRGRLANLLHTGAAWLFCAIFSWEAAWRVGQLLPGHTSWTSIVWAFIPAGLLLGMPRLVTRVKWPFAENRDAYLFIVGIGIAVFLSLWSLVTNLWSSGDMAPLPYCPLLNPLDLAQIFVLVVLFRYWRFLRAVRSPDFWRVDRRLPMPALAALVFVWLNAVLLRTLHQWFGVPFGIDPMLASTLVQTSLSIFWAVLSLVTMLIAARQHRRIVWMVGAGLLTVVIAKLFLVDLSRIGSIERIVSFVGVGLLMLIVGYLSPIPPAEATRP
jgi:uncharacterized membrane protein